MAILDPNGVKLGGGSGGANQNHVKDVLAHQVNRAVPESAALAVGATVASFEVVSCSPEVLASIKKLSLPPIPKKDLLLTAAKGTPEACGKAFKMSGGALAALMKGIASIIT